MVTLMLVVILISASGASRVFADVTVSATTESTVNGENIVAVAGNPDFYPYEYYDAENGMYRGLFPNIYALIGMETGYSFVYINAGENDNRLIDAKVDNADIVSAYLYLHDQAEDYNLKDAIPVVEYEIDGHTISICIIFSHYASDETVQEITEGFKAIPQEQINRLFAQYIYDDLYSTDNLVYLIVIAVLLLILLGFAVRFLIFRHGLKKQEAWEKEKEYFDPLTGLGNMRDFGREVEKMNADPHKPVYAMAYIGFDISKVNQEYGTEVSEELMRYAANILSAGKKKEEYIARVAGGALGMLHVYTTDAEVRKWAEEQIFRLNVFNVRYSKSFTPKFRCGVYRLPSGEWEQYEILKNISRCYDAAVENDSDCFIYDAKMEKNDRMNQELGHEAADAVKGTEIVQYLQPIIDAQTREIKGAEGLARWRHPELGVLQPQSFVPIMVEQDSILALDMRMFEDSCRLMSRWREKGKNYFLSTNFNRMSLADPDLVMRIESVAGKYFFSRRNLVIEITEDSLEGQKETAFENIRALKDSGFSVSLDDLGSGFTFFADLKNYPLDEIKLDRSLLLSASDERGRTLMTGVVRMCREMGMKVVCEGVEDDDQYQLARDMGCDYIQGYAFYKVLNPEEAEKVMG